MTADPLTDRPEMLTVIERAACIAAARGARIRAARQKPAEDPAMTTRTAETLQLAATLLDCAMPHFVRQARAEERRNAHATGLREVTCRNRLAAAREIVDKFAPRREEL